MLQRHRAVLACAVFACACSNDNLGQALAELVVVPLPASGQSELTNPEGIELGQVPLFGIATARFSLENPAAAPLEIRSVTVEGLSDAIVSTRLVEGGVTVRDLPLAVRAQQAAILEVDFEPTADAVLGRATIALGTNAGRNRNAVARVQVQGTGWFIGEPALEIEYQGQRFSFEDGDLDGIPDVCGGATEPCVLPTLDYGNVRLETDVTEVLYVRNTPPSNTCRLPALPDGSTDCRPACVVEFDRDPARNDLGLGFIPNDEGFSVVGSAAVPFTVAPEVAGCDNQPGVIRGELRLLLRFVAGVEEDDHAARMVLESSVPGAPWIEIPLEAKVRQAPVAVARIANCIDFPTACSDPSAIRPLSRVYLEGTESYDPRYPDDPDRIVEHVWEIIEAPSGADPALLDPQGATTELFDMFLPLAGEYRVRLRVRNELGILSGVSPTSDVIVRAIPDERLHVQLVWDHPTNDLDLHLVYADGDRRVLNEPYDCFWVQCGPACVDQTWPRTPCDEPVTWFPLADPMTGPNPRLDRDDTNGLGPENINIDEPQPGNYDVYVHYYGLEDIENATTQVTVRLFLDGALRYEYRRVLGRNNLWAVARISWQEDQTVVIQAESDEPDVIGSVFDLGSISTYPTGSDFGGVFGP